MELLKTISKSDYEVIESLSNSNIYHTKNWHDFLKASFDWQVSAAIIRGSSGEISAFLPFVVKRRMSLKPIWVCLPLSHSVGIAHDDSDSVLDLVNDLKSLGQQMEIRASLPCEGGKESANNFITTLDLSQFDSEEELYRSFHKKRILYPIKRALKSDITVSHDLTVANAKSIYALELDTRMRQGSPMYPESFFANLIKHMEPYLHVCVGYKEGVPISASVFFHYKKLCTYAYSASVDDKEIKKLGSNELLLWLGIEFAKKRNFQLFDFGTTPLALPQLLWYKEKWGGVSEPFTQTVISTSSAKSSSQPSRDGLLVKSTSQLLRVLPKPLYSAITPQLLKIVA